MDERKCEQGKWDRGEKEKEGMDKKGDDGVSQGSG